MKLNFKSKELLVNITMDKSITDKDYFIAELKQRIRLKIGFQISTMPDCNKLSEEISAIGLSGVSGITIYRVFIHKHKDHQHYKNTLHILTNFIGFNRWDDFVEDVKKNRLKLHQPLNADNTSNKNSLIFHCIQQECFNPLEAYFDSIEDFEHDLKFEINLDVYDSLLKVENPFSFYKRFAKNKFVRKYLFEYGFDPSFRIKDYDEGFDFYVDGIKPDESELELRVYIFGFSVLLRHYYIHKNFPESIKVARKLYHNTEYIDKELEGIYIFPRMRFLCYKVWYMVMNEQHKNTIEQYVEDLLEYCKTIYPKHNETERKIIYYVMAETFIYADINNKYHLALKAIFIEEFNHLPSIIFDKNLLHSLSYFESNGLMFHRPL